MKKGRPVNQKPPNEQAKPFYQSAGFANFLSFIALLVSGFGFIVSERSAKFSSDQYNAEKREDLITAQKLHLDYVVNEMDNLSISMILTSNLMELRLSYDSDYDTNEVVGILHEYRDIISDDIKVQTNTQSIIRTLESNDISASPFSWYDLLRKTSNDIAMFDRTRIKTSNFNVRLQREFQYETEFERTNDIGKTSQTKLKH